jgi:hypothetical protein
MLFGLAFYLPPALIILGGLLLAVPVRRPQSAAPLPTPAVAPR